LKGAGLRGARLTCIDISMVVQESTVFNFIELIVYKGAAMEDLVIEEEGASSALKITLGDFLVFINWMNQTEKALERGEALPTTPDLDSGKVKGWIQLVQRLEERFRRSEEKKIALEANVIAQEAQLGQLLTHLHANIASLYENLGQSKKAEEVRRRAEALHAG
jgi:hypothetical protein